MAGKARKRAREAQKTRKSVRYYKLVIDEHGEKHATELAREQGRKLNRRYMAKEWGKLHMHIVSTKLTDEQAAAWAEVCEAHEQTRYARLQELIEQDIAEAARKKRGRRERGNKRRRQNRTTADTL